MPSDFMCACVFLEASSDLFANVPTVMRITIYYKYLIITDIDIVISNLHNLSIVSCQGHTYDTYKDKVYK